MIKVENDMLVLDNTFTKEDVQAIDEFVKINVDRERERIIELLLQHEVCGVDTKTNLMLNEDALIALIKNFGE
jgi:hypothetical protein